MAWKSKIETRLFNGYVADPIPIVILASIVGIASIALALWATISHFIPSNALIQTETCFFTAYAVNGPCYELDTNTTNRFRLQKSAIQDENILIKTIGNADKVTVSYEFIPNKKHTYSIVEILDSSSTPIVSKAAVAKANASANIKSMVILWTFCVMYNGFAIGAYCILCNAPKHPHIASLLIRKAYRNF